MRMKPKRRHFRCNSTTGYTSDQCFFPLLLDTEMLVLRNVVADSEAPHPMFNRHQGLLHAVQTAVACNLFVSVTYVKNERLHTLHLHADVQKLHYLALV